MVFDNMSPARTLYVGLTSLALVGPGPSLAAESKAVTHHSRTANPHQHPYEARSYPNKLEIFKGGNKVSILQSEGSDIERWGFIDAGQQVVVKTRNGNGEVVLELFDTATGVRKDKVVAPTSVKGQMSWADGFID